MSSQKNESITQNESENFFILSTWKDIGKILFFAVLISFCFMILDILNSGIVRFNGLIGLSFLFSGLFIIIGSTIILYEPLQVRNYDKDQEVNGITIKPIKRPKKVINVGLRNYGKSSKPFNRRYWGKIILIAGAILLIISMIIDFIILQIVLN